MYMLLGNDDDDDDDDDDDEKCDGDGAGDELAMMTATVPPRPGSLPLLLHQNHHLTIMLAVR